jgi:hypothetical protein
MRITGGDGDRVILVWRDADGVGHLTLHPVR